MRQDRRQIWRHLLGAVLALGFAVQSHPAQAEPVERTAPYDFGSHDGSLVGAAVPCPNVTYSIPPFPTISECRATTETGIYIDTIERSWITLSATVRANEPVAITTIQACWAYTPPSSRLTYSGLDCVRLPANGELVMATQLDEGPWHEGGLDPGRHAFSVHLSGDRDPTNVEGATSVTVEHIAYELSSSAP